MIFLFVSESLWYISPKDVMSVGKFGTVSVITDATISVAKCMNTPTKWGTNQVINSLQSVQGMFCC